MRQRNKKKFVMLTEDLLNDPDWIALSANAKIAYIYLRAKFSYKNGGEVSLTYREMKNMVSSATLSKAFKELLEKKFIEKATHGGLYRNRTYYKFIGKHKDFYFKGSKI